MVRLYASKAYIRYKLWYAWCLLAIVAAFAVLVGGVIFLA